MAWKLCGSCVVDTSGPANEMAGSFCLGSVRGAAVPNVAEGAARLFERKTSWALYDMGPGPCSRGISPRPVGAVPIVAAADRRSRTSAEARGGSGGSFFLLVKEPRREDGAEAAFSLGFSPSGEEGRVTGQDTASVKREFANGVGGRAVETSMTAFMTWLEKVGRKG